jgi:hypothetical protein
MIAAILNPLRSSRTYLRIAYLLIAFPLATAYFVVIVTGLTTGLGLAIVFIGSPAGPHAWRLGAVCPTGAPPAITCSGRRSVRRRR